MKIIMYIDTFCRYNYIAEFTSHGKQAWINKPTEGGTPNKGRCPTKIPQQITKTELERTEMQRKPCRDETGETVRYST